VNIADLQGVLPLTESLDGLQVTPIKDSNGNLISFTVSGGVNIKTLLDKFLKENCKHDVEWTSVEGFGTVGECKICGEKIYDD